MLSFDRAAWRLANVDKLREARLRYTAANPNKVRESRSRYAPQDKKLARLRAKKFYASPEGKLKTERFKVWARANASKVAKKARQKLSDSVVRNKLGLRKHECPQQLLTAAREYFRTKYIIRESKL